MNSMAKKAFLCVDDDELILTSLRDQIFSHFGHKYIYEMAENVEEAWEVIEELTEYNVEILIIISDWFMPGIKGDEFLIQVHQQYPTIIKVLLTGQADKKAIERTKKEAQLYRCLFKPWNKQTLINTIESGLEFINA